MAKTSLWRSHLPVFNDGKGNSAAIFEFPEQVESPNSFTPPFAVINRST